MKIRVYLFINSNCYRLIELQAENFRCIFGNARDSDQAGVVVLKNSNGT